MVVFVPGKPFQLNLMFVCKVRSEAPERWALALPPNIRQHWKALPVTNTTTY